MPLVWAISIFLVILILLVMVGSYLYTKMILNNIMAGSAMVERAWFW